MALLPVMLTGCMPSTVRSSESLGVKVGDFLWPDLPLIWLLSIAVLAIRRHMVQLNAAFVLQVSGDVAAQGISRLIEILQTKYAILRLKPAQVTTPVESRIQAEEGNGIKAVGYKVVGTFYVRNLACFVAANSSFADTRLQIS